MSLVEIARFTDVYEADLARPFWRRMRSTSVSPSATKPPSIR